MKTDNPKEPEVARGLRLVKEYWLRTIQPFIKGRRLRGLDLFMAVSAHRRLEGARRKAEEWNRTEEGKSFPVPAEALAELEKEEFREPEELWRDDNLKPEALAAIAAPLMSKRPAELTPDEAVCSAHELLLAAGRYIGTLPEQKCGIAGAVADFETAFSSVSFTEILRSNDKDSGRLPLLPPVQDKRNEGVSGKSRLSLGAIKSAVRSFLAKRAPSQTQEEYERLEKQQEMLTEQGRVRILGDGKPLSYQEWQKSNQEAIDDCMKNNQISLEDLCTMRWERFKGHWDKQQLQAAKRKPPESKKPKTKLPKSAATSPITAGKRQK